LHSPFLQTDASDYGIGGVPLTVLDGKVRVEPSITIPRLHDYLRAHQIEDSDPKGIQVRAKDLFKIFSKDFFPASRLVFPLVVLVRGVPHTFV